MTDEYRYVSTNEPGPYYGTTRIDSDAVAKAFAKTTNALAELEQDCSPAELAVVHEMFAKMIAFDAGVAKNVIDEIANQMIAKITKG